LDWAAHSGSQNISKADFLATVKEIRAQTFIHNTVLNRWRRTGLMPFNPDVVLSQLKKQECNENEHLPALLPCVVV
jgi:hypothetical protein